ncbi:MAG: ornithine cyclodeaminase family protein [Solirubrobacteraceae bacterium]
MRTLILSYQDVRAALAPGDCADAMAEVLAARARGEAYMPLRSVMMAPGAPGAMGLMPAYRASRGEHTDGGRAGAFGEPAAGTDREWAAPGAFALKAICLMPANPGRGLDTHQGIVTLFDGETGVPTAILNASAVTEIRTAAVTAVATRLLARDDARVLAILGAGVQARAHLEALAAVRAFEQVRVHAPTTGHAQALADTLPSGGPTLAVAVSARAAIEGADVVVTATSSRTPVLECDWLAAGAHVNAVGASTPMARELDVATVAAGGLFCDSRESLRNEAGEYRLAIEEGAIDAETHVRGELGEVLAGLRPGRRDALELTVFRSLGIAVEDLAAAEIAVAAAQRLGLGTEVQL